MLITWIRWAIPPNFPPSWEKRSLQVHLPIGVVLNFSHHLTVHLPHFILHMVSLYRCHLMGKGFWSDLSSPIKETQDCPLLGEWTTGSWAHFHLPSQRDKCDAPSENWGTERNIHDSPLVYISTTQIHLWQVLLIMSHHFLIATPQVTSNV